MSSLDVFGNWKNTIDETIEDNGIIQDVINAADDEINNPEPITDINIEINNDTTMAAVSFNYKDDDSSNRYCPVYVEETPNGKNIVSYIHEQVLDVDTYIELIDALLMATENDTVTIYIDSPGGYIAGGGMVASAIHHSKAQVFTVARGMCASAAALIHSSAKPGHAKVGDYAVIMYHMSSHMDYGSSTKIAERAANQVKYVNKVLLNKAVSDGHLTEEELSRIQNGDEIFLSALEFQERTGGKV